MRFQRSPAICFAMAATCVTSAFGDAVNIRVVDVGPFLATTSGGTSAYDRGQAQGPRLSLTTKAPIIPWLSRRIRQWRKSIQPWRTL
jgi:hypothetical protein